MLKISSTCFFKLSNCLAHASWGLLALGLLTEQAQAVGLGTSPAIVAKVSTHQSWRGAGVARRPLGTLGLRIPENPIGAADGLEYQYFQDGNIDQLPNFASLTPRQSGTTSYFDIVSMRQRDYAYALRFTGYVTVPTNGEYTFFLNSDDGSQLFIGSQLVVDNDGTHGVQEHSGTIGLEAGTHAFTVTYFQSGGPMALTVSYQPPGGIKQVLPAGNLHHGGVIPVISSVQAYPNPNLGHMKVHYSTARPQGATIYLTDEAGRRVGRQTVQLQSGNNEVPLEAPDLSPGFYLLWFRPDLDGPQITKIVVGE